MCGRFFIGQDFRDKLNDLILAGRPAGPGAAAPKAGAEAPAADAAAGRDVVPSSTSTVICGKGRNLTCMEMKWGFLNPYRKGLVINARAESAGEKALFKESLAQRRCIIPASGFFEWDSWKARFRFTRPDGALVLLAGLYRPEPDGLHYTILTTEANPSMAPVHERMPVMLEPGEMLSWIFDGTSVPGFLGRPQAMLDREQDEGQIRMELG